MRRRTEVRVRFHPGQDDDLLCWLEQFDGRPYGVKSQAIKEALRRGIGLAGSCESSTPVNLADIRQVVEAAVTQALERVGSAAFGDPERGAEEDDETEVLLDSLGVTLVLRE